MPGATTDGWPYSLGTDLNSTVDETLLALATKLQGMYLADVRSARPSSGYMKGRRFVATDSIAEFVDTGSGWIRLSTPAGTIIAGGSVSAPAGYVAADGSAVSRTGANADLFAELGTTYGAGNGTTTFNVPDLRGRVPVGVDGAAGRLTANDALGNSGGAETHTLTKAQLPVLNLGGGAGGSSGLTGNDQSAFYGTGVGSGQAHNNMQPFQVFNWVVKL